MKKFVISLLILTATISVNAQRKLEKLWETDTIIKTPESVLYDGVRKVLYVSW
jgi:hypothetical protein